MHFPTLAIVMRQGVYAVIQSEYKSIIVKADNKILIQAVPDEISVLGVVHSLIQDIQILLWQATSFQVQHVYREGNMAVD